MTNERMVDLLVIGGGVAGLATAITAKELGADVLLVEKQDHLGGTAIYSAGNLLQLDGPEAFDHLSSLSFGRTPDDVLAGYLTGLVTLRLWLEDRGAVTADVDPATLPNCWPHSPGADDVVYYALEGPHGAGPALVDTLHRTAEGLGVDVSLEASMTALTIVDGSVVGAEIVGAGGTRTLISARHGVVLAAGGFENNPSLTETYLPISPVFSVGSPGNTGDAVRAAQSVGAALWHMSNFYGFWCLRAPHHDTAFPLLFLDPGHLIVDADGRRFHAETGREAHDVMRSVGDFLPGRPNRPGLPAYAIFDRGLLDAGPLCQWLTPSGYSWSADNSSELASGWISSATSTDDLAKQLDVDSATLTETVDAYNAAARLGVDTDFGRPADSMGTVDTADLFAVEVWPGVATTSGGPRRNQHAQVLSESGQPIPGLYAAGNNGGVWGHLTEHGGGLTDGLVFGAIAARTALGQAAP